MKRANETHIEGLLYEHKLTEKVSGENSKNPGTKFINGEISIATNNALTNIVKVHFSYVTETTKNGKPNTTYNILSNIIEGKLGTVMGDGADNAAMLRIDSAIGLNEWYDKDNNLVSQKRNEGGFVHQINVLSDEEKQRNTFKVDIVITGTTRIEADEEKDTPEKMIVKGAIFDFRNQLLPVELTMLNPKGMDIMESFDASSRNPVFTRVWGQQISQTQIKRSVEESAFGDDDIKEIQTSYRDFVITGMAKENYEWDSEETITAQEMAEAVQQREITLAELKQRQEEYQNSKNNAPTGITKATSNNAGYDF